MSIIYNTEFLQASEKANNSNKYIQNSEASYKNVGSYFVYDTAIGKITIVSNDKAITAVNFGVKEEFCMFQRTELTDKAAIELDEYFTGKRRSFDVPLYTEGTLFQNLVWKALLNIPYGETRSYKQIAEMIKRPGASRAVGMANNKNPIMIMIPCHRVIGSNGSLVGYAAGLEVKEYLLTLERRII